MRTIMTLLFAGVMSTATILASPNDQLAEERHKAKTGRYSPAEEVRRERLANKAISQAAVCEKQSCCRCSHTSATDKQSATRLNEAAEFLRAKWGLTIVAAESPSPEPTRVANFPPNFPSVWSRAKWGRDLTPSENAESLIAGQLSSASPSGIVCERLTCCD